MPSLILSQSFFAKLCNSLCDLIYINCLKETLDQNMNELQKQVKILHRKRSIEMTSSQQIKLQQQKAQLKELENEKRKSDEVRRQIGMLLNFPVPLDLINS